MDNTSPDSTPRQLDIFADSQDVMLRNDLRAALARQDEPAGHDAWGRLADAYPDDALLAPAQVLLAALKALRQSATASNDAASLAAARLHLRATITPAATAALGNDAAAWLAPLQYHLAQRHAQRPWNGARPDDHAAPLWLAAGEWARAEQSIGSIASWRRIPQPLAWMVEARAGHAGVDGLWPLLAELAWLAPGRLDAVLRQLADPLLSRLRRRFEDNFEIDHDPRDEHAALAWFPAWVLTEAPALAPQLAAAEPGQDRAAERGLRLLVQLLGLERQGRQNELPALRRSLRDLCAPLYAAYMAKR